MLWGTPSGAGQAGSVREAMDRALRLPGARSVVLGDLAHPHPLAWAHNPPVTQSFALDNARICAVLAAQMREQGEEVEDIAINGASFLSLLHTTAPPATAPPPSERSRPYIHVTLSRAPANLALATMALHTLAADLPRLLAPPPEPRQPPALAVPPGLPGLPAGDSPAELPRRPRSHRAADAPSAPPRSAVPLTTLQTVLQRLRLL